ncbi:cytochrome b subunit of the bc complex [Heliorestis convoluta]|uniref:Subunit IV of cytochrome bc complex, PetD n=1 Tax=Heliorestis convoluta TaxID=356322 RepID=A0A5Q2N530_9FIRM|nr:cytochrome b subunit of the bc complex [Heliorestis convoluta]QGG48726.1 Subunit IV of cytochrome bc complex, PetD [Heliorestis convoluta]
MEKQKKFTIPFMPTHITTEAAVTMVFIGVLLIMSGAFPKLMHAPADPLVTPMNLKPEWYILWGYAILEMVPNKLLGVILPGVLLGLLVVVPWLERNPHRHPKKRVFAVTVFSAMIVLVAILTYIGATIQFG